MEKSAEAIVPSNLIIKQVAWEGPNLQTKETDLKDSKFIERQKGTEIQLEMKWQETGSHVGVGEGGTRPEQNEVEQVNTASDKKRALNQDMMEEVSSLGNLTEAMRRVKKNKGAAGVDRMTTKELPDWLQTNWKELQKQLLDGSYQPQEVRGVQIPKANGGSRQLGIPTVKDRLVQQALLQELEPLLDSTFSESSYGFRPKRSAHQALRQASQYVKEGRLIVVDMDLEKFFDRVNHDILMSRLARHVKDKRVLRIVRRYLEAGMMQNGVKVRREEGTPQGGPLSPLLANLLLDDLDKELERRGHKFCRYADDSNIYVKTQKAGERVLASITEFIERRLKLKVNREKSAVAYIEARKFLGYRLLSGGRLGIAPKSLERMKIRVREITRRNRSNKNIHKVVQELNNYLNGWIIYFQHAQCERWLSGIIDPWIRRRLRCLVFKGLKSAKAIGKFLLKHGINRNKAWKLAGAGKGWWRMARTQQAHVAMSTKWFSEQGLINLTTTYRSLKV